MAKRALLVGCNYPGEQCELKGSVNDVERMRILLIKRFGFHPSEILELVDVDPRARQPTGANIRRCLRKLIEGVEPGDVLLFHFSGHGTRVPSERGRSDETGYEECIVPSDMNLLSDDDFRELVDRIPPGVNFTFIADSCHSGGLIDSEKGQIGDQYSSGGRPRPPGLGRPPMGGERTDGFSERRDLVSEGVGAYASAGGGKNNAIMSVAGQALGSRSNRMPDDEKNREFDPQEIDANGRLPESPYERRYVEGGMPEYPTERLYERQDPREVEMGSYEDGGYERRGTRGSDRPYAGSSYTQKFMRKTPTKPATGYANETLGSTSTVKFMQSGLSVPETGYAERAFGFPTEQPFDGPGSPYSGGYGRSVGDDYGYPPRGATHHRPAIPGDDEFGYPPRGAYERPLRPADDDYGYPGRPLRSDEDDYGYPARPLRSLEDDYRYPSEAASWRRHGTEDSYVRAEDDPYDRYRGERRHSYDPRDDDRRRPDRELYETEHERRGRYGEGSSNEDSLRHPAKYPSEYSGSNYGVYPETGERYGDHGYSGKPHHTPLKNKSLPIEMLTDILSHRTGQNVRLGNIHRTLYDLFGEDASPTVKLFVNVLLNKMEDNGGEGGGQGPGLMGKIGGLASQLLKTKPDHGSSYSGDHPEEEFEKYRRRRRRNYDAGILISACGPQESSADANPTNNPRDAYGALSNAIQTIIGESRGPLTNRQVVMAARKLVSQQGYKQHPCLYCSDRNADALFLTPM